MRALYITRQAKAELAAIQSYTIHNYGHQQARKYLASIRKTCQLIQANPRIGHHKVDFKEPTYAFTVENHVLYYSFDDKQIFLLTVLHQSMLPNNYLK
ncbi:type II toxin-antitoxin system RelE/ParE family toxin [Marinicella gelatinilytica]|uniref:type II toxin-antitoxin system RelE/ParE family toxin n=1 Tax=Marinicella gelatinilytica TaxID=2996017 RepID=UPI002260C08A|nr:type II toxin-antitoxin system RelE/ParE family toxin [Marinicella gelatinilytica]MCX7545631.1 type II toxin-antitoxin system RelE/ParE family toxin [Marinicella gelatinilytica]